MAQDQVTLYNLALSAAGTRARISIVTEGSRESEICQQWYETVRDQVLRSAHWPSCRATSLLTLDAERQYIGEWAEGDPEPPWQYRYHLPQDFLYPRYLDTYENFELCSVADGTKLLSQSDYPVLTYTKRQTVVSAWDQGLWNAMIFALAGHIAMPLHGKGGRASLALQEANAKIIEARTMLANQNATQFDSIPDWLLARGAVAATQHSQFIYHYGPLFNTGSLL